MHMPDSLRAHEAGKPPMMVGWMDEAFVIVAAAPIVIAFIPGYQNQAKAAFLALSAAPDWYADVVFVAFAAVVGLQIIRGVRLPLALSASPPFVRQAPLPGA